MPIHRDPIHQTLARLSLRLAELAAWRDREVFPITEAKFRTSSDKSWQTVRSGDPWPAKSHPVLFQFQCSVPETWAGNVVHARFDVDGEALLFANRKPIGGLNTFHQEHLIAERAIAGETFTFDLEAVPHGLFGTPVDRPRVNLAALVWPDQVLRSLLEDLSAAHEAAHYLASTGREEITRRLADALDRALAGIILPRGNTPSYLARIAATSKSRSLESFYANAESLDSIWEEWQFTAPPAPLDDASRRSLEVVQTTFQAELQTIRQAYPSIGSIWLTGHAHIDLAWLWPLEETRRKARRTFHTVSRLMERFPRLHFNQSSAQLYAWIEQDDPDLFEQIRTRVHEGRWDIVGGMWVEPDGNLPAGESWVRQILLGQRYFQLRFGKRPRVAWIPDSFGFTGNLPQLLLSGGLQYFFTHKMTWNERNLFPYDLYWWEGIDGSRVLAHSFFNPGGGYNGRVAAYDLGETWRNFKEKDRYSQTLLAVGHGDGGGGPSSEMLDRFERFRDFPGMPRLQMGQVAQFYEGITRHDLPVWVGEKYLEFHRGTYTTQSQIKSLHRRLEHALIEAETATALASGQDDYPYPITEFTRLWQTLLLNEFHDILPGSSINSVYETAKKDLGLALETARSLRDLALARLSGRPLKQPLRGSGIEIWNLQLYDRQLRAEIKDFPGDPEEWATDTGQQVCSQVTSEKTLLLCAPEIHVPALGSITLLPAVLDAPGIPRTDKSQHNHRALRATSSELENECIRAAFNADGTLAALLDKQHNRQLLADRGNQLWIYNDLPRQFDAWDIDASYAKEGAELPAISPPELIEAGPVRASIKVTRGVNEIEIVQEYRIYRSERIVEIRTKVRWHGRRRLLRAIFPVEIRTHEGWTETAFGAVPRPTHRNTPWDQARFEVPGHRWADLSEPHYGVSLLTDSKYGYSIEGNVIGLSLLRSPIYPDPFADEGYHEFSYALYPHPGDWRTSTVRAAMSFNSPLRGVTLSDRATNSSKFVVPIRLTGDRLELSALKKAEDSEATILRVYEPHGDRGQAVIESAAPLREALLVNLLEEPIKALEIHEERRVRLSFRPFQVLTLKLR
jgi:alpha-mannosidase